MAAKVTRRAIFLVGFNNWGKTSLIRALFHRSNFSLKATYCIPSVNASFTVLSGSNDDWPQSKFIEKIGMGIEQSPDEAKTFLGALCPSREAGNNSRQILASTPFAAYEIHLMLLKHKWDFHAELRIEDIRGYLGTLSNVQLHVIDAYLNHENDSTRAQAKELQILSFLQEIFV